MFKWFADKRNIDSITTEIKRLNTELGFLVNRIDMLETSLKSLRTTFNQRMSEIPRKRSRRVEDDDEDDDDLSPQDREFLALLPDHEKARLRKD